MRAYSLNLRERIIAAHLEGISIRKIAKQYKVNKGTVSNLIKLRRETGQIKPKPVRGGKQSQLAANQKELAEMVEKYSDYTLEEYCEYWDEKTGVRVSTRNMCRQLKKLKLTIKKNATD